MASPGTHSVVDDTTFSFSPNVDLFFDTEYWAYISGVDVVRTTMSGVDTVAALADTISFRTAAASHVPVAFSHPRSTRLLCSDTLSFAFNRPLDSVNTPTGPVMTLSRLDSVTTIGDTVLQYHSTLLSCPTWLSPGDSSIISLLVPASLLPGHQYYVDVFPSRLGGDTTRDARFTFVTAEAYELVLASRPLDTNDVLPDSLAPSPGAGMHYPRIGETVRFIAPRRDSSFTFLRWDAPDIPSVHNSTMPSVSFVRSCASFEPLEVTAIYDRHRSVSVTVDSHDSLEVTVYSSSLDSLGGPGIYTLAAHDHLVVAASPSCTNCQFGQWTSSIDSENGHTTPARRIYNNGNDIDVTADPVNITPPTPVVNMVCATYRIEDGLSTEGEANDGIISYSPDPCVTTGSSTTPITSNGTIAPEWQSCFCIDYAEVLSPAGRTIVPGNCSSSLNVQVTPTSPSTTVVYVVKRKNAATFSLAVSTELTNNDRYMPDYARYAGIGIDKDVTIGVYRINRIGREVARLGFTTASTFTVDLPCGCDVKLVPMVNLVEEGFNFVSWYTTGGYNTYPTPPSTGQFVFRMDQNRSAKGSFNENFRIRKVGFHTANAWGGPNTLTWLTTKAARARRVTDINIYGLVSSAASGILAAGSRFGTSIFLSTNDAVASSSLPGNIRANDASERIDELPSDRYRATSTSTSLVSGHTDTLIRFDLWGTSTTTTVGLPKGQTFGLTVGAIANQSSEVAYNRGDLGFHESELPGVRVKLLSARPLDYSGDVDGDVELAVTWAAVVRKPGDVGNITEGDTYFAFESLDPEDNDVFVPANPELLSVGKLGKDDQVCLILNALDRDGDWAGWEDATQFLIASGLWLAGTMMASQLPGMAGFSEVPNMNNLAYAVLGALFGVGLYLLIGFAMFKAIEAAFAENPPDPMGDATWTYGWKPNHFGGHSRVNALQSGKQSRKIEFDVEFELRADE